MLKEWLYSYSLFHMQAFLFFSILNFSHIFRTKVNFVGDSKIKGRCHLSSTYENISHMLYLGLDFQVLNIVSVLQGGFLCSFCVTVSTNLFVLSWCMQGVFFSYTLSNLLAYLVQISFFGKLALWSTASCV